MLLNFCYLYKKGRVSVISVSRFLETDIGEQEKYEKRINTYVDYTVNDLRYEFKFENRVKNKSNFFNPFKTEGDII